MASSVETAIRSVVTKGVMAVSEFNRARQDQRRNHPFLTGIHAPMTEERTIENLTVTGTIPAELSGRYVRIGPNPFKPDPRGHHWFIGDGMVHGVRIQDGKALWYRNRYIRSQELEGKGGPAAAPGPRRGRRDLVNTNVISTMARPWPSSRQAHSRRSCRTSWKRLPTPIWAARCTSPSALTRTKTR